MKTHYITIPLLAVCAALFTSCDKAKDTAASAEKALEKAADPKAAFKAACDVIAAKVTEASVAVKAGKTKDGIAGMTAATEALAKVPLEGLPADLKTAFASFTKSATEMTVVMKDLPEGMPMDQEKMGEFMKTAGPEVMQKLMALGPKMQEMKPRMDAAKKALEESSKAAGIDLSAFLKAGD